MALTTTITGALKQIEKTMGSKTFEYDGETFDCHSGNNTVTTVLETGGFDETQQIVLVVRKEVFDDDIYPVADEKIIYNEITYYVDTINADATDAFLNIALKKTK